MRILLFVYPWLELTSLIQLGIETNALVVITWVLAMFFLGGVLIRRVGVKSIERLREAQRTGLLQQNLLADDMAMAVAGVLLIIPGLLSDFFGLVILLGPLRRLLARLLRVRTSEVDDSIQSFHARGTGTQSSKAHEPITLEGDFYEVDVEVDDRKKHT